MKRDGGRVGPTQVVAENALCWTSDYGSLVTTVYGIGTADGINERGLAAHMLYFKTADFGTRDSSRPGLHAGLWAQYLLDNAATVEEAVGLLGAVQLVMVESHGHPATVHLAIACNASVPFGAPYQEFGTSKPSTEPPSTSPAAATSSN